jgi:hypothetical protein
MKCHCNTACDPSPRPVIRTCADAERRAAASAAMVSTHARLPKSDPASTRCRRAGRRGSRNRMRRGRAAAGRPFRADLIEAAKRAGQFRGRQGRRRPPRFAAKRAKSEGGAGRESGHRPVSRQTPELALNGAFGRRSGRAVVRPSRSANSGGADAIRCGAETLAQTGSGFTPQISSAYCWMVRSLENRPELAILWIAMRAQSP